MLDRCRCSRGGHRGHRLDHGIGDIVEHDLDGPGGPPSRDTGNGHQLTGVGQMTLASSQERTCGQLVRRTGNQSPHDDEMLWDLEDVPSRMITFPLGDPRSSWQGRF